MHTVEARHGRVAPVFLEICAAERNPRGRAVRFAVVARVAASIGQLRSLRLVSKSHHDLLTELVGQRRGCGVYRTLHHVADVHLRGVGPAGRRADRRGVFGAGVVHGRKAVVQDIEASIELFLDLGIGVVRRCECRAGDDGLQLRAVRLVRAQRAHHLVVVEGGRGAGAGPVRRVGEVNLGACLRGVLGAVRNIHVGHRAHVLVLRRVGRCRLRAGRDRRHQTGGGLRHGGHVRVDLELGAVPDALLEADAPLVILLVDLLARREVDAHLVVQQIDRLVLAHTRLVRQLDGVGERLALLHVSHRRGNVHVGQRSGRVGEQQVAACAWVVACAPATQSVRCCCACPSSGSCKAPPAGRGRAGCGGVEGRWSAHPARPEMRRPR